MKLLLSCVNVEKLQSWNIMLFFWLVTMIFCGVSYFNIKQLFWWIVMFFFYIVKFVFLFREKCIKFVWSHPKRHV